MKIDQKELAQIIKDYPQKDKSQTKINCPSPKKLTALLRFELPDRQRGKVIGHLANCSTCTKEIKFINGLLKAENGFDREAAKILTKRQPSFSKKELSARVPFPHLSWRQGVLAAVATFLILFSSVFLPINPKKTSIERSALLQLEQINPNDISLSLDQLIFQWEKIPESDYFTVEVFDDSLNLVWRSKRISENKVIPSAELKELLKQKGTYCWMVTSFLRNGKQVESPLAKFNLE